MTTRQICETELAERIENMQIHLEAAQQTLKNGELLQSAVRIQEIVKYTEFSELVLGIFDSIDRAE